MFFIAFLSLTIWCGLLIFRGAFWRADQRLPKAPDPEAWPDVAIIIPARNEAETIGQVITAHMQSDYPGKLDVFLVDDTSTDETVASAQVAAKGSNRPFHIVSAPPLQTGWSGKLWAVNAGLDALDASDLEPKYVLLTDADIQHGASLLRNLVAQAEASGKALISIMSHLDDRGVWGSLLIPAFIFFFQKLYPFRLTNITASKVAGAAGGVMLLNRQTFQEIGGVQSIRHTLIDDCALAERIKKGPPERSIGLYLADAMAPATSLRDNRSFESVKKMVSRTAFTQLEYSTLNLIGTLVGMALVYLVAPLLVLSVPLHQNLTLFSIGLLTWILMSCAYMPTLSLYRQPLWRSITLPVAALFYSSFTFLSAWQYWRGKGGQWKGRTYA